MKVYVLVYEGEIIKVFYTMSQAKKYIRNIDPLGKNVYVIHESVLEGESNEIAKRIEI